MTILPPKENFIEYPTFSVFLVYTNLNPATLISLIGYNYQPVKTEGDYGYWEYWVKRWAEKKKFVSVEHDIVPWPGAIESLWNCPEIFCTFDHNLPIHRKRVLETEVPLGCVKITPEFIEKVPHLWDEKVLWNGCDVPLANCGIKVHQHTPSVVNANPELLAFANIEKDE